jgi:hypothetical protein
MANDQSTTLPTPIPTPLNVTALAKRFGVARSTIQRRLKKGWTPPMKVPRKVRRSAAPGAPSDAPSAAAPVLHQQVSQQVPQISEAESTSERFPDDVGDLAWLRTVLQEPQSHSEPSTAIAGRVTAIVAAIALTAVAAYFSVSGMTEIFPGAPTAIIALAGTMEVAKLVIAGFLAANWHMSGWLMRIVVVTVVAGLAVLNGAGVYGRLTEAHLGVTVADCSRRHSASKPRRLLRKRLQFKAPTSG